MLIPYTQLDSSTLDSLLEDYVTRDGTDNGHFTSLKDRKDKLLSLLKREEAFITYNVEHAQPCLVPRHEVPPEALREYRELKLSLDQEHATEPEAGVEAPSDTSVRDLKPDKQPNEECETGEPDISEAVAQAKVNIQLPFDLGRTLMTQSVKGLLDNGKVKLEELQELLSRHSHCDFGTITDDMYLLNCGAIRSKDQVRSIYHVGHIEFLVETERGHTQTMVMIPSDR